MKRLFALLTVCILLAGVMVIPVSAESSATKVELSCNVKPDGDCQVAMTVMLRLDGNYPKLTFPLPPNAKGITMNGASVRTTQSPSAVDVDISKIAQGYVGELTMQFSYTVPDTVKVVDVLNNSGKPTGERQLQLELPLLNGFQFPVNNLSFVVNMPSGKMSERPDFTSIYRQSSFNSDLEVILNGSQIIGASKVVLNDHEGVMMTMKVPKEMFPTVSTYIREGNPELPYILICAGLALIYWLFFLRTRPLIPTATSTPPEGITAGELGCRLTLTGGDLTCMVFSWAELGYLLISLDGNGRVLLHKRMDMGNERDQFENKVYKMLFGNRRVVDATGYQYAKVCHKVAKIVPNERNMHKHSSGSKAIYRLLLCAGQVFCGICVSMNMTSVPVLQILLSIILGAFGAVSAWLIQEMAYRTHLRGKVPVKIGMVCIVLWILLGLLCGQVWIPLGCALGQMLLGYFAAYGGRRSDLGRHDAGQVLGFRRYLKKLKTKELERLLKNDPDYFFHMAPHALALGIINSFSRNFGEKKISQCPYIVTRVSGKRTAEEWGHMMQDIADMMDAKERRMQVEKWLAVQVLTTTASNQRRPAGRSARPRKNPNKR